MSNAIAIALKTARRYGKQEGGMVSEEDIERERMNQENAPREGGLLQTVPQFWSQMQTPEGRGKLWEATKQEAAQFIPGMIEQAKVPGEAMAKGITPEQEAEWSAGTAMGLAGGHMPFAGEGQIGVFGGKSSPHFPHENLPLAEAMRDSGIDRDKIWNKTGIGFDEKTGEPFYHHTMNETFIHPKMPADPANPGNVAFPLGGYAPLTQVLKDASDRPYYEAYPWLKDWKVGHADISKGDYGSINYPNKMIRVASQTPKDFRNTLIHEVNHAVQEYENFARGSNWRRFVPEGFEDFGEQLKQKSDAMENYLSSKGYDPTKVWETFIDSMQNPSRMTADQRRLIHDMIFSGDHRDILDLINHVDRWNTMKTAALDNYARSLGEVRSRAASWMADLTPEESREIPPWRAQEMMPEAPIKAGTEFMGPEEAQLWYEPASTPVPGALPVQDKLGFYSKADEIVGKGPKQAHADQWMGMLKNAGLKPEEDQYLGISDWLKQQKLRNAPVSKVDLQSYIRNNRIKLRETVADQPAMTKLPEEWGGNPPQDWDTDEFNPADVEWNTEAFEKHPASVVAYPEKTIPGGENYREIKLALQQPWSKLDYHHQHFPYDPNQLAFARVDDRIINGKKTLFVNELQSDWHQEGARHGYMNPWDEEAARPIQGGDWEVHEGGYDQPPPDAPYKKVWPELMFKRLLRHAAEGGYDQIAWAGNPGTIRKIEGWPSLLKAGDKWHGPLNKDFTPIINRYLRDLPNIANKLGKPHNAMVSQAQDFNVLPITPALRKHALTRGFSDWKRGGMPMRRGGAAKMTKKATHYRPGYGIRTCENCTMFRPPSTCTAVAGHISPKALCDLFKRKKGSGHAAH